jgi:hypothetical protein
VARDLETERAEATAQKDEVKQKEALSEHFAIARRFALSLARQRMSWGLDIISSWPKRCVLLTDLATTEQQKHAVDEFKVQIEIVRQALASEVPLMKTWALRSHLALTPAVQAKAILEGDGRKLTARSREFILQRSLRLMGTQVLEDGFKAMKQTSKKNPTQRISDFTAYHTLSEKKVLTKMHHFEDPPEQGGATIRGDTLDASAFTFAKDKVWTELLGGKTTLLQAAARVAFGKQSKSWLVDIAHELHCEVVQFVLEIPTRRCCRSCIFA